jgi:hypothetical protein
MLRDEEEVAKYQGAQGGGSGNGLGVTGVRAGGARAVSGGRCCEFKKQRVGRSPHGNT